jgi:RimJ/RimL family protein N-acetyltransferase
MMTEQDLGLRVRMQTDPEVMAELGGPRAVEDIRQALSNSLVSAAEGETWPLKIVFESSAASAGTVDVFPSSHDGESIYEIGWMILPECQGRGVATEAVHEVLRKARAERRFGSVHAFPAVSNAPSNRICEKNGFTNLGECQVEGFAGRLQCNHWRIDLF